LGKNTFPKVFEGEEERIENLFTFST